MQYPGFIGGSNPSQSVLADGERCINWYPEATGGRPALYPTPGQRRFVQVTDIGTRGLFSMNGRCHAVVATGVYELFAGMTTTSRGNLVQDGNPATFAYKTPGALDQLVISSGTHGYLLNMLTNVLTQVLTGDATMVGQLDGYFLAFNIATSSFRWSALNDGSSWPVGQVQARSIAPDLWQAMVVDGNRQIWLIGEQTGEVWYDAGTSVTNPWSPIPGAVFGYGTPAPFSVKVVGDRVIWLSRNVDGAGMVVSARGYTPERVSTHAIETLIANYARTTTIGDAEGLAYQDQGHLFYALTFPQARATLVFDVTTGQWHERGTWLPATMNYDIWAPRVHAYAFGQHLVGERGTGSINTLDVTIGAEADGSVIRRVRIPPPLRCADDVSRLFVNRLDLLCEPGLGTSTGQGSAPVAMLRTSINAKTWSNERTASAGAQGRYGTRCFWTRLASSPDVWVPEISVTDPIPWRIIGCEVSGRGFTGAVQSRAA